MEKENVRKFYEKLENSKELREKLVKAQESYTGNKDDREAVVEAVLLPIAKEAGYDFTTEELKEAEKELVAENGISEDELENVGGGVTVGCSFLGFGNGVHAAICIDSGVGTDRQGGGFVVCFYWGVGIGAMNY